MKQREALRRFDNRNYHRVMRTEVGDTDVSTIWFAVDSSLGDDSPVTFETMILDGDHNGEQWHYDSEPKARRHHWELVRALATGKWEMPDPA